MSNVALSMVDDDVGDSDDDTTAGRPSGGSVQSASGPYCRLERPDDESAQRGATVARSRGGL